MKLATNFSKKARLFGLTYTNGHRAKMQDISSLNTAVHLNKYCKARAKNARTICAHCFAVELQKVYKNMSAAYAKNTEILTTQIIPAEYIPQIKTKSGLFRFEAFGDLNNWIQFANYCNIAAANTNIHFAIWTKNPQIIAESLRNDVVIPDNMQIIYSSPFMNTKFAPVKRYPFINKIFTVYNLEYINEHKITVNCGAKSCATCRKCYTKSAGIEYINEQIKRI